MISGDTGNGGELLKECGKIIFLEICGRRRKGGDRQGVSHVRHPAQNRADRQKRDGGGRVGVKILSVKAGKTVS